MKYQFANVALLVTHYNRSLSLERLLHSFKELECFFEEIIVSDDCSKPEHIKKLEELQIEYNFRLITTPKNRGLGNNLNKGQDAVTAKYTLYIQEDFIPTKLFPDKLVSALNMIETDDFDFVRFYAYKKYPYLEPYKDGFSKMKFKFWCPGYRKYYFYSDHPHLRRSTFLNKFGRYAEGIRSDKIEYRMMMSVVQKKAKALFYEDFRTLVEQANNLETSTVPRGTWRYSNKNPLLVMGRAIYRNMKFSFDYLFLQT